MYADCSCPWHGGYGNKPWSYAQNGSSSGSSTNGDDATLDDVHDENHDDRRESRGNLDENGEPIELLEFRTGCGKAAVPALVTALGAGCLELLSDDGTAASSVPAPAPAAVLWHKKGVSYTARPVKSAVNGKSGVNGTDRPLATANVRTSEALDMALVVDDDDADDHVLQPLFSLESGFTQTAGLPLGALPSDQPSDLLLLHLPPEPLTSLTTPTARQQPRPAHACTHYGARPRDVHLSFSAHLRRRLGAMSDSAVIGPCAAIIKRRYPSG